METYLLSKRCGADNRSLELLSKEQQAARDKIMFFFAQNMVESLDTCPLCQAYKDYTIISLKDVIGISCSIVACDKCGFVFQNRPLNRSALEENYKKFSLILRGKTAFDPSYMENLFLRRVKKFSNHRYAFIVKHVKLEKDDLILELGCNDGANLYPFFKNGYKAIGYDLDEQSLHAGRQKGLNLQCKDMFSAIEDEELKPKLVILSHVLEHFLNPGEFLQTLYNAIPENSVVFIEVPGYRNPVWVSDKTGVLPYFRYEHILYFEMTSLNSLMRQCGFKPAFVDETVVGLYVKSGNSEPSVDKVDSESYLRGAEQAYLSSFKGKIKQLLGMIKS